MAGAVPPADGGRAALTVSEVSVRFGGVAALNGVSLGVEPGVVTGLIGPNGAGKTTLFNVISGLQVPDRGTVHFFDVDVTGIRPHRRARLGLARTFQRLELFGSLTAGDNVRVGIESAMEWWRLEHLRRILSRGRSGGSASVSVRCQELLGRVGLAGRAGDHASAMSTGSARMIELARALALEPKLLLLDEPGSGLDDAEAQALGELLTSLARDGMAVLLVEHDMELVMRVCQFIYVLDFGEVIAAGSPEEVRADPRVQAAYLGAAEDVGVGGGR